MKKKNIIAISILTIIDIIIKSIIMNNNINKEIIKNFFYITPTKNYGAAFSILKNERMLFLIVTIIIIYLIINYTKKKEINKIEEYGYSLIISGALGNFIDRLIYGYVIDYIDIKIFTYNYPIFNLADSLIVIGVILIIIDGIRKDLNERNRSTRK